VALRETTLGGLQGEDRSAHVAVQLEVLACRLYRLLRLHQRAVAARAGDLLVERGELFLLRGGLGDLRLQRLAARLQLILRLAQPAELVVQLRRAGLGLLHAPRAL